MKTYLPEMPRAVERTAGHGRLGEPATALGARLRDLRVAAGLSQLEVSVVIARGGGGRVSDHELGFHQPTLTMLQRYAALFGTTVSAILDGVM